MPLTTDEQLEWIGLVMQAARGQASPLRILELIALTAKHTTTLTNEQLAAARQKVGPDAPAAANR